MPPPLRLLARTCARLAYGRLDRRLTAGWSLALMGLVFLLTALDWDSLRAFLTAPTPQRAAGTVLLTFGGLALLCRPLLRAALYGGHMAWLWRQPVPPWQWSVVLLPLLALAGLPLLGLPLLSGDPLPALRIPTWALLWGPVAAAVSGGSLPWSLLALGIAAGIVALLPPPLALPLAALWALAATGHLYSRLARTTPRWALPSLTWRPRAPLGAAVQRDLLCLLRTEPRALLWGSLPAIPAGALLGRLEARGTFDAAGLDDSAAVLLALGATGSGLGMAALSERLGERLAPRQWPLSAVTRAVGLGLVALLLSSPAMAAVGLSSPPARLPLLGSEWLAIAAGAALLAHRAPRLERPYNLGTLGAWASLAALLAALIWPGNLLLAAAGIALLARRLR